MRKHLLRYMFRLEYFFAGVLVLFLVFLLILISNSLPDTDETSFLDPVFGRIDFLNIKDVSLDAIFALKSMAFSDPRIVVVNVGESGPTPDGKIALLLERLHSWRARVIGIDIFFDARHFERFPPERQFEVGAIKAVLRRVPRVVLAGGYDEASLSPSVTLDPDIRAASPYVGFVNLSPDDDKVIRRFWPYRTIAGERELSFPVLVTKLFDSSLTEMLLRLPEEEQIIYYTGTVHQFPVYPIDDLLVDDRYAENCRDAIVLIGLTTERGLSYLGDMHKTPMGRKTAVARLDGSTQIGVDGPDMPGVLIHANVVNMLLRREFIFPVPGWVDWVLTFLLSYMSIVLYRIVRVKPRTALGLGILIGTFLIVETIVVFFIPIIAFFYFDIKISYHLMATSVLLFIPAVSWTTKLRYILFHRRTARALHAIPAPLTAPLLHAFEDDEPFPSYIGSLHAAQVFLHYAFAVACAFRRRREELPPTVLLFPLLPEWRSIIPEIDALWNSRRRGGMWQRFFYSYLESKKGQYLKDSAVKEQFLSTQYDAFNPHLYFEEWDVTIPHVLRMIRDDLRAYHGFSLFFISRNAEGTPRVESIGFDVRTPRVEESLAVALGEGLFITPADTPEDFVSLSPFGILAECKLHRVRELFLFAGLVRKQLFIEPLPVYYGRTVSCEAVLSVQTIAWFRERMGAILPQSEAS